MKIMSSRRHTPQRMCVACRQVTAQRELIRLVRVADNRVEIDHSRKKTGRGGYLCQAEECWKVALKRGLLGRALRTTITPENQEELIKWRKELHGG